MDLGYRLFSFGLWEWVKVLIILIVVISPIIGFCIAVNTPSSYQTISVEYKFVRNDKCYVIGKITSQYKNGKIDIYLVDKETYDEFMEGFEYSISTKGLNKWTDLYKSICDFKPIIYD